MRVVYTAGVWDLLHRGHLNVLWESKKLGDVLVVGVVSDAGCFQYKRTMPAQHVQARVRAVQALGFVDVVVEQVTTDPTDNLRQFSPEVFTHADGKGEWGTLRARVEALGIEYVNLPYSDAVTSTELRSRRFGNGDATQEEARDASVT